MSDYIFNFSNPNWKYKGVLSAEADYNTLEKEWDIKQPPGYTVYIVAFIWVDEVGDWFFRVRLKFPSGHKQVYGCNMGKDSNETLCLEEMYRFPMQKKKWIANPSGILDRLLELMKKHDMIESIEFRLRDDTK